MYCTHCGIEIDPNAKFCKSCGKPAANWRAQPTANPIGTQETQAMQASSPRSTQMPPADAMRTQALGERAPQTGEAGRTSVMPPTTAHGAQDGEPVQRIGVPAIGGSQAAYYKQAQAKSSAGKRSSAPMIAVGAVCAVAVVAIAVAAIFTFANPTSPGRTSSGAPGVAASSSSEATGSSSGADSQASAASSSASAGSASSAGASKPSASAKASKSSASAVPEPDKKPYNQQESEAEAANAAYAAGMEVLTGTVRMTTYAQRASEIDANLAQDFSSMQDKELALLVFDYPQNLAAAAAGNQGLVETRSEQGSIAMSMPDRWRAYDGQVITVAGYAENLMFPSDVAGALYSAIGTVELIAPLADENAAARALSVIRDTRAPNGASALPGVDEVEDSSDAANSKSSDGASSSASAAAKSADYVLPDSATRAYTKSELQQLSDYELFLARNEIYARHGREFQNAELRSYFESKSWYKATTPAASFDESKLSNTELDNAELMLQIEQSRNSKYLQ